MSRGSREWMKSWGGVVKVEAEHGGKGEVLVTNGKVTFVARELPQTWLNVTLSQLIASLDLRKWKFKLKQKQEGLF